MAFSKKIDAFIEEMGKQIATRMNTDIGIHGAYNEVVAKITDPKERRWAKDYHAAIYDATYKQLVVG